MRAVDVMSRPVVSVSPVTPVRSALVLLVERGFGALPVVTGEGEVVGVVSESELLRLGLRGGYGGALVADVMVAPPVTVPLDTPVAELAEVLLAGRLRCVPVVDAGELVGVVSRSDLLRTLVQDEDMLADRVRWLLHTYAGMRPRWSVEVVAGVVFVTGPFADEAERRLVVALARTVPGVDQVELRPTRAATPA